MPSPPPITAAATAPARIKSFDRSGAASLFERTPPFDAARGGFDERALPSADVGALEPGSAGGGVDGATNGAYSPLAFTAWSWPVSVPP